jgi:hypothetical protein
MHDTTAPAEMGLAETVAGRTLRMGAQGAASILDIAGNPIKQGISMITGGPVATSYRDDVSAGLDALGVAGYDDSATGRITGAMGEGMVGAGGMAKGAELAGRGLTGVSKMVADAFAAQPAQQIAGGAGAGLGGAGAAEMGLGSVGQVLFSLAGGLGAAGGVSTIPGFRAPVKLPKSVTEAGDIPVMTSDLYPPKSYVGKWARGAGEMIPLAGTSGPRVAQNEARIAEIQKYLDQHGAGLEAPALSAVSQDLLARRKIDLQRYTGMKSEVVDRLSTGPVPVPNAVAEIDKQIAKLGNQLSGAQKEIYTPVVAELEKWKSALTGAYRAANGASGMTGDTLAGLERTIKDIGDTFSGINLANVRTAGKSALNAIYGPLKKDMGEFIAKNGDRRDLEKWKVANGQLSKMVDELSVNAMKNALNKGEVTPETARNLLMSRDPSTLDLMSRSLTAEGRAAARTVILDEVLSKAMTAGSTGLDQLSPDKFKNALGKVAPQLQAFFGVKDYAALKGLIRALKLTEQAASANVMTKTGQQLMPLAGMSALSAIFGGVAPTVAGAASIGAIARIYESPAIRNLLIQLGTEDGRAALGGGAARRILEVDRAVNK